MSHVANIPRMERGDEWECPIGVKPPKLPAYLDGAIEPFEFNEDSVYGSFWFSKILGELQTEHEEAGGGRAPGFIHNKTSILKAWREHRLFGLRMARTESVDKHHPSYSDIASDEPPVYQYLWKNHTAQGDSVKYAFPLFCVVEHTGHLDDLCNITNNTIEYLWVAKRARGVGLGRCMSNEICCDAVFDVLPSCVEFWRKVGFEMPKPEDKKRKFSDAN